MGRFMKICLKCKIEKDLSFFHKNKRAKDGFNLYCKSCRTQHSKVFCSKNKNSLSLKFKKYYFDNKNKISKQKKEYYKKNRDLILSKVKTNYLKNKEQIQKYKKNNKEKINKTSQKYTNNRLKKDPQFKLLKNLRSRVGSFFKKNQKNGSAVKDLGCTVQELKIYLESKFQEGMTWENHGIYGWHIDHIMPLSYFDLTNREQFLKACHYTNLQPLWAADNLKKSNKIIITQSNKEGAQC